ncbi:MAG: SPOR domain-containing protein [Spirochaetes bacterium]|jgi:hypothetical protein|nr:SPOR domain-containing protein [Spirochaetota bacterium]
MQNIDFYSGNVHQHSMPDFVSRDPEYFSRMTRNHQKEGIRKKNRATRFLVMVLALCIISFTSGLVVGMKFNAGADKEIVDPVTRQAMSDIGNKVNDIVGENNVGGDLSADSTAVQTDEKSGASQPGITSFPKQEYPFVIRIGNKFSAKQSQEIADYLSNKGHTVILARQEGFFRIYAGPYKTRNQAESNLNKINYYRDNKLFHSALILKR